MKIPKILGITILALSVTTSAMGVTWDQAGPTNGQGCTPYRPNIDDPSGAYNQSQAPQQYQGPQYQERPRWDSGGHYQSPDGYTHPEFDRPRYDPWGK